MKLKVLVISRNAWNDKAGNTYSNFFQEFESHQLAQVFCRDELPFNNLCEKYYCISEKNMVKSFFVSTKTGFVINKKENQINNQIKKVAKEGSGFYDFFRNYRFTLLLWLRELVWFGAKWQSKELVNFIKEFNPDVIYTEAHDTFYTYRVLDFVQKVLNIPYVLFHCDDQLTYNKFSLSPLFWVNRFILRYYVSKAIKKAAINYCIIDEQRRIYNKILPSNYKILNKSADFYERPDILNHYNPIKIIYAGNLHLGRWKTLQKFAESIKELNKDCTKIQLDIYTGKSVSNNKLKKIEIDKAIKIHDFIPYKELIELQKKSHILLHLESFNLKHKLITYLSFSTKIVDFFEMGKCILAIGWKYSAPIKYLKEKDSAIVICDLKQIKDTMKKLTLNDKVIEEYSNKSFECGKKFHSKDKTLAMFNEDLMNLSKL